MAVIGVPRRELVVAAVCALVAVAAFLAAPLIDDGGSTVHIPSAGTAAWSSGLLVLIAQGGALLGRTARPVAVLIGVATAVPIGAVVGLADAIGLTTLAVLVAVYTVVSAMPLGKVWPALVGAGVLVAAGQLIARLRLHSAAPAALGNAVVQALGAVVLPLVVAMFVVARRDARQSREHEVLAGAREREARLQAAVSHERMSMARELHDIAAHHLSGIAVMTAAIGTQIDTDPDGAKQAVAQVREQSRTLLRDLRGLVGLLRDDRPVGATAAPSRQQSLAGITELVDDATAAGAPVGLTVLPARTGDALGDGVGPLAQLAAYRIVQESLANAARHAPGAQTRVVVDDRGADDVLVTIVNEAPRSATAADASGGFGLVGMRERADLTGARLDYGPTADGGWQVSVTMPRLTETTDPSDASA